jgi:ABC-type transporter MlaC component
MPRNYAKEYKTYHGKPEQIKRRDARNKARAIMVKKGVVRKGDGLHIDHRNNNPLDNRPSNLRAVTQKANLTRKKKKN